MLRTIAGGVAGLCLLLAGTGELRGDAPTAVAKLDLVKFTGAWYEVARYPKGPEKNCVSQPMSMIAKGSKPGRLQLVHTCGVKNGDTDVRNGVIMAANKRVDGELKRSYLWPFSSKYWVLALGPDYAWALVGSPNHKELRVLSRTARMKPEVLAEIETKAAAQGFDPNKLIVTR